MTISIGSTGSYSLWSSQDSIIKPFGKNKNINQIQATVVCLLKTVGNKKIEFEGQNKSLIDLYDFENIIDSLEKAKIGLTKNRTGFIDRKQCCHFNLTKLEPKALDFYRSIKNLEQALNNLANKIEICEQNKLGKVSYDQAKKEFKTLDKTVKTLLKEAAGYIPKNKSRLKTYAAIMVGLTAVSVAIGITIFTLGIGGTLLGMAIGLTGPIISCLVTIASQFKLRRDPAWKHLEAVLESVNFIYNDLEEQNMYKLQLDVNNLTQNFNSLKQEINSIEKKLDNLSQQVNKVGNHSNDKVNLDIISEMIESKFNRIEQALNLVHNQSSTYSSTSHEVSTRH